MSNLGLERMLAANNIGFERTAVGDRYIMERMHQTAVIWVVSRLTPVRRGRTGDGMIAAFNLSILARSAKMASGCCLPLRLCRRS